MSNVCKRNHHLCHRENRYSWQRIILFIHLWWWSRRKTTREEIFFSDNWCLISYNIICLLSPFISGRFRKRDRNVESYQQVLWVWETAWKWNFKKVFVLFVPNIFSNTAGNNEEKHNTTLQTKYKQITPTHYNNHQVKNTLHNAQIICR